MTGCDPETVNVPAFSQESFRLLKGLVIQAPSVLSSSMFLQILQNSPWCLPLYSNQVNSFSHLLVVAPFTRQWVRFRAMLHRYYKAFLEGLASKWPVMRYLVRVHKWSGWTKYVDINGPTRTIYVVISGPPKT